MLKSFQFSAGAVSVHRMLAAVVIRVKNILCFHILVLLNSFVIYSSKKCFVLLTGDSTVLVTGNMSVNKAGSILALREHPLWKETGTLKSLKNKLQIGYMIRRT